MPLAKSRVEGREAASLEVAHHTRFTRERARRSRTSST
jgi:hypothetical protein